MSSVLKNKIKVIPKTPKNEYSFKVCLHIHVYIAIKIAISCFYKIKLNNC